MIQLGDFADQQTKRRITIFSFVVFFTAQFASQHVLQLAVIRSREGDVVCQLIDGKRISVFVDVAIDFGAIVFEIIPRLHRVALFLIYNRVR